ncbi:hypothetical protein CC86DRAFT_366632 [Ophiobolus disseminans]|uniref:CPAF-like PDZ domain-containing protein n=1 Tax=Ophiobolus disseminans TaxID=1469910 RepID=A0A6A7AEA6_9PLEO|nr:hypothetical protein CC86DRAFT_366632 [Ophiobolus disseminans]
MLFVRPVALLSFVALALSKPLERTVVPRQGGAPLTEDQTICGDIVVYARNGNYVFYADAVFRCLQSVPFNGAVASRFIAYYNMTLQFQSTLAYLKDPPPGYQQPAVDVFEVLGQIQNNITAGVYKNQYGFEADVQLLVNRMHDSHVTLSAGILDAFSFVSPVGLVSVSADGKQAPEVYIAEDLLQSRLDGYTASPITKINGQDVVKALTDFAELNSDGYLEPHADWNALMDSPAQAISGDLSVFQSATFYPGDELEFTFKNGSTGETFWLSIYNELDDTGPLTTAGDFYNYFVLGQLPASYDETRQWWPTDPAANATEGENVTTVRPYKAICDKGNPADINWCETSSGAYPNDPIVAQTDLAVTGGGVVTGYLLKDISTGVLSIPSFYQYDSDIEGFILAVHYFISNATQQNISRVIIDLQTNDGGAVFLAYQTFKQFFYGTDPYAASRIRSHGLANILGDTYSKWWKELEDDLEENGSLYNYTASEEWVVVNRINAATGGNFSSWADYYSRVSDHGDLFSAAQRYNLSDEVFDVSAFSNWVPYGYGIGIDDDAAPQIWAPEDIVILTDGLCASACALFVEFVSSVGVRTVTVGGRPTTGPMQGVAGSRGARVYEATELDDDFSFVSEHVQNDTAAALLPSRLDTGMWVTTAGINIRDQVRANDPTPLQFKYEAADCRIYYTLDNIYNMTRLWHDAAKATWDDRSFCVSGSTGFPSARNTNSTQAPPKRTAEVPALNLDLTNPVNTLGNATSGIDASNVPRTGEIVQCSTNSDCGHGRQCKETPLKCGNGSVQNVKACLPGCASTDKSCPGTSQCNYAPVSGASKLNAVGTKSSTSFSKQFEQGLCRPTKAGLKLSCKI